MKKIERLTPEQEAELPRFRQRYLDIACGGGRIDCASLKTALADAYALIGKPAPALFIFDSPAACMLALKIFAMPETAQLQSQLQSQLGSQLQSQLQSQLGSQLQSQLQSQLGSQLRSQLWSQLGSQLGSQLWSQLGSQLRSQLGSQLWSQLQSQLWSQLRTQLQSQLGSQLQSQLWSQLWSQLQSQLGSQLQSQLGSQKIYNPNYLWGSHDLYWLAWGRFAANIGVDLKPETQHMLDIMERISMQCEWWWPYENMVIVSERPSRVRWDDESRLHCENGPAIEYADGYSLSSWHGQPIPGEWVTGRPPKASEALHWSNMDQRAAACEIVGWANILDELDAKVIDDSGDHVWGRLVEVDLPDSGRERFLDALCGTMRRFALPVPPQTKTVDEAQSVLHGGLPVEILRNCVART